MSEAVRHAIETSDIEGLRVLLLADPELGESPVPCGDDGGHLVPPLHLVCDAVFRGRVSDPDGLLLADLLLGAGVEPDQAFAKSGDTFLISAASLGAEAVGLRLVERGVDVGARGLFGATALHWASLMGLDRLADALAAAGAELELADARYRCSPLEWAIHAWKEGTSGHRDRLPLVAATLVRHGAQVPRAALGELRAEADGPLRSALLTL